MKFKFSLEKLIDLKIQEEKIAMSTLAEYRKKILEESQKLRHLEETYSIYAENIYQNGKCTVGELKSYFYYLPVLHEKIVAQKKQCVSIEKKIESILMEINEMAKERKVIEKLKEKKFASYLLELNMRDQKQLDEMALNQFYLTELRGGNI